MFEFLKDYCWNDVCNLLFEDSLKVTKFYVS
jgi:hypothetical protein